ncbi:MAG: ion channel [Methyloceanibacter sp.]
MDDVLFDQIVVGGAASLVNLIIHALLLGIVVWTVHNISMRDTRIPGFLQYTLIIVLVGTLLVVGHFVEVLVWANTYVLVDGAPPGTDFIYLAFGNYTTVGYGDVRLRDQWHILGPMTALNGIMLIGWSTALIFDILRRTGHLATKSLQIESDSKPAA